LTDSELIDRVLKGERHAFTILVNNHKDMAFSLALRITKSENLAEEVAQDAFLKVYTALSGFRKESRFTTWLYRIVINAAYTKLREKKPYEKVQFTDNFIEVETGLDGFDRLSVKERGESIKKALGELEKMDAVILTLFYLEEYSVEEMVETTGLSKANVKVKLHRARKKLAEVIEKKYVELLNQ